MVYFGSDEEDPYDDDNANGWGIGLGIVTYILGLVGSILCMIWRIVVYERKLQKRV